MTGIRTFLVRTLLLLAATVSSAHAGEFCSTFPDPDNPGAGLIDADAAAPAPFVGTMAQYFDAENITQITIDTDCTFRNWDQPDPLDVTINFQTNDPSIYLITFDNTVFSGNMACANIDHQIWFVNGNPDDFSSKCQDLFIPVEAINKLVQPTGKTTVGIGEVFTYRMRIPVLYNSALGVISDDTGSLNDIHSIIIQDNLNNIGANLSLVGTPTVEWAPGSSQTGSVPHNFTDNSGDLQWEILPLNSLQVVAGDQIEIILTLSVDGSNAIGTQFFNTATWTFGRLIDIDGVPTFFDPLPGENGVSEVLTVGAPQLTVQKTSPDSTLNIGVPGSFTIRAENTGNTDAWNPTIVDVLPDIDFGTTIAGMCENTPGNINVALVNADNTLPANQPVLGDDYSINFTPGNTPSTIYPSPNPDGENCDLEIVVDSTGSNSIIIAPGQRLEITYTAALDPDTTADGETLFNYAAATEWFSANPGGSPAFISYPVAPTPGFDTADPGTPGDDTDHQDGLSIETGLSGYFFTKSVQNLTTGEVPSPDVTLTAVPGDTLRYTLRVFNVDQNISNIVITDDLTSTDFDQASFSEITAQNVGVNSASFVGGVLTVNGINLAALGDEVQYVFDIDVSTTGGLVTGDTVSNQASLDANGVTDGQDADPNAVAYSDDPFQNGTDDPTTTPGEDPPPVDPSDPTVVGIQIPGPLLKADGLAGAVTSATIGDEITYRITVPQATVSTPLYDVRILDDLTANGADLAFVSASVVSGGSWTLTNTGTATDIVIEDTGAGIDILAGNQAVIDVTVRVANTINNDIGDSFTNTADYTYNRINNSVASQVAGSGASTVTTTTITESQLSAFSKTVDNPAPTSGETVRYSISLTADSGANLNDVFDVTLEDSLDLGLVYAGNPTVTTGGAGGNGVGDDNTIGGPDINGDGINTPQALVWTTLEADIDIDAGETVVIEYDVLVDNSALANQTLNNSAIVQWTGIEGDNANERTGIDGAGVEPNDYATPVLNAPVTIPDVSGATAIVKERIDDTFGSGDDDVRIGDIVDYRFTITVPENTLGNLTLVDTLPQGLDFIGVVSIGGDTTAGDDYTATAPFSYAAIPAGNIVEAGDPAAGDTTVTWSLGDVNNQPVDGNPDDLVIVYQARVLNGDVLLQQDSTLLNNQVVMSYDTATTTVNNSDIDTNVNVVQPNATISKTAGGDIFVTDGEVITYTVNLVNTGTAPLYDPVLRDTIPAGLQGAGITVSSITLRNTGTDALVTDFGTGIAPTPLGGGVFEWNFDTNNFDEYTIPVGHTLRVIYTVTADNPIADGLTLINTAELRNYYSLDDEDAGVTTPGTSREVYPDPLAIPTDTTTLFTSSLPTKELNPVSGATEATIGEDVIYRLTVPGTPSGSTLFDVSITDTLDAALEHITGAISITGGTGVTDTSTANSVNLAIDEIAAGTQVVIDVTVRVRNANGVEAPNTIDNDVSYSYAYTDNGTQQGPLTSTDIVTLTIVEPDLTITKSASANTATPGDTITYTLTASNGGDATAFDVNVVDTIPAGMSWQSTTSAAVNGAPIGNATPANQPNGPLVWGRDNGGDDIDIPAGQSLVIVYDVVIDASVGANVLLDNSALVDWTSLDGVPVDITRERTGADCPPNTGVLNDYCDGPVTDSVTTVDNNNLVKSVVADSFAPDDGDIRIGDTATYRLELELQEGTTDNVVVTDTLDAGLAFAGIVSINGDTAAPFTPPVAGAGSNFSYTINSLPSAPATGTLTFDIGDVVNDPGGDATTDTLVIDYLVTVPAGQIPGTLTQQSTTPLTNSAVLSYDDGVGNPVVRPPAQAPVDLLQPVMDPIDKLGLLVGSGNPFAANTMGTALTVAVASDTVRFLIESCNNGLAPAYNLRITDTLASQLDEGSITNIAGTLNQPDVTIAGNPAAFSYDDPDFRGDSLEIVLNDPVGPGECVVVNYDIGFYTDFGPDQVWSNDATINEYWSLPGGTGEEYTPTDDAQFWMTNTFTANPLDKVLTTPAGGEATIGEIVVFTLTVPETAPNATIFDVNITDMLHPALQFISANDTSGNGFVLNDSVDASNILTMAIDQIPAGQTAVIEVTARVANNADASGGTSIANMAGYTYADVDNGAANIGGNDTAANLLLTEPELTLTKGVTDTGGGAVATAVAGDTLRYTLTIDASGGAGGDAFSDAFDLTIVDDLGPGLKYDSGSVTISAGGISEPVESGDGSVATPHTLTWTADDIDLAEGGTLTVTYDVVVMNSVLAGQSLANDATLRWTGLDDGDPNEGFERDGSLTQPEDDYITTAQAPSVSVPDTTAFTKAYDSDTSPALTAPTDVRIGDVITYQLDITLPEGTSQAVSVVDTLDTGMEFAGIVEINGDTTAPFDPPGAGTGSNFSYNSVSVPAAGATGTLSFDFGDIVNDPAGNPTTETITVLYNVRVQDGVHAQNAAGIALDNTAQLNYTSGAGAQNIGSATIGIDVLQPDLTVTKTSTPASGDIVANQTITYTIEVANTGTAAAYDPVIEDILPAGLRLDGIDAVDVDITTINTVSRAQTSNPADIAPTTYDVNSGTASWDFGAGSTAYTIEPGDSLLIVFDVDADPDLGPGLSMLNQTRVTVYYSFDDDATPDGNTDTREVYAATPTATPAAPLTTTSPGVPLKESPFDISAAAADQFVSIGDTFTYRITVPQTPVAIALHDVRVLDDFLNDSAADLSIDSVAFGPGNAATGIPANTGAANDIVIEDVSNGLDIPANGQLVLDVTVVVNNNAAVNTPGLNFTNTASYTYNQFDGGTTGLTNIDGGSDVSGTMIIVGPENLIMSKTGPATMRVGVPETFTLSMLNEDTGSAAAAYDIIVTDVLPQLGTGGMCDTAPTNITAGIYDATGTVLQTGLATPGDYLVNYSGCTLTVTMTSANAGLPVNERLVISYDAELDPDTVPGSSLTNIAGATEWSSNDDADPNVDPAQIQTITNTLTNGTPTVPDDDFEDAHTLTTEAPVISFFKTVANLTTGAVSNGTDPLPASPGDRLEFSIALENVSAVDLPDFTFADELDALNASPYFAANTLVVTGAAGGTDSSSATGGASGTGRVEISNLSLGIAGSGNEFVTLTYEVDLIAVIDGGTLVQNQAQITAPGVAQDSDDPNINGADVAATLGDEDATQVLISSAPAFEVQKTSTDLTGDPAILVSGDTLRYTITVRNTGSENAVNVSLQDTIPANTTYVAGSTTLNANPVADPGAAGTPPLAAGLQINAPVDTTAGNLPVDTASDPNYIATVTFDVTIDANVLNGTLISNQGFVDAAGAGSGAQPQQPSDDPGTTSVADDPTVDIVGNQPLLDAQKTVALTNDVNGDNDVDPGDELTYTIVISNFGTSPATGVTFVDPVPVDTGYSGNSTTLNGVAVADPALNVSPLIAGIGIQSSDVAGPLPGPAGGTVNAGESATVVFSVTVNGAVPDGTLISNQGTIDSDQLPGELTDADGNDSNGDQPTVIPVGDTQVLSISKQVTVVGGGPALGGGRLEYRVRVENIGVTDATSVVIRDDLDANGANIITLVPGSATLQGSVANVVEAGQVITATQGVLAAGDSVELRFLADLDAGLTLGTTITNTAVVDWDTPTQTTSADATIDIGSVPGFANIGGTLWHDADYDDTLDAGERLLEGWSIELYFSGALQGTTTSDANGAYAFTSLLSNDIGTDRYELRFVAPGAGSNTALLGEADSPFTNTLQNINDIVLTSGGNELGLNLPIDPNGVVYDAVLRSPVAGVPLTLQNLTRGVTVPGSCFDDAAQQGQVTLADGYYKFDLNFSQPGSCQSGDEYSIEIGTLPTGYIGTTSLFIPPQAATLDLVDCQSSGVDRLSTTPERCEVQGAEVPPATSIQPGAIGTEYYLNLNFTSATNPYQRQVFNNHIPVDPELDEALAVSKISALLNVTRSQLVPYTITLNNTLAAPLYDFNIVDTFPAGFKYIADSATLDGVPTEPAVDPALRTLTWPNQDLITNQTRQVKLLLVVGAGVSMGEYVNNAQAINNRNGQPASELASATVRVIPDPTFDCTDIIGKVYDDANANGYQDEGETGLAGAGVLTATGLEVKTDEHGRFHLTCAVVPDESRGSNFIMKLDERSLPTGYRVTTENPRVERATRGKMLKFSFGATIHRVVRLDFADAVFEPDTTEMRPQWIQRMTLLMEKLVESPSVLRLSYLGDIEDPTLAEERLEAVKRDVENRWADLDCCYELEIETELFWRRGRPASTEVFDD